MFSYIKEIKDKEKALTTIEQISKVTVQLKKISSLTASLSEQSKSNASVIGDLVEKELLTMDKAIEEAAARIQVI